MTYAYTRQLTAAGLYVYDAATTYTESPSPAEEIVLRIVRTSRGQCQAQPALGVEWAKLQKLAANAPSQCRSLLVAALLPLQTAGTITSLVVTATADPPRGLLAFQIDFEDPRLPAPVRRRTVRGTAP